MLVAVLQTLNRPKGSPLDRVSRQELDTLNRAVEAIPARKSMTVSYYTCHAPLRYTLLSRTPVTILNLETEYLRFSSIQCACRSDVTKHFMVQKHISWTTVAVIILAYTIVLSAACARFVRCSKRFCLHLRHEFSFCCTMQLIPLHQPDKKHKLRGFSVESAAEFYFTINSTGERLTVDEYFR